MAHPLEGTPESGTLHLGPGIDLTPWLTLTDSGYVVNATAFGMRTDKTAEQNTDALRRAVEFSAAIHRLAPRG